MNGGRIGLLLGPFLAFAVFLLTAYAGLALPARGTAALLALMAVWWATEALPLAFTSLLPLAVLPLIGAGKEKDIAAAYADPVVLLLMGGFILATGIERWGLHRRLALNIVASMPRGGRTLIAGFMLATAVISMWISNTATTLMMLPIALSAASVSGQSDNRFTAALLLGVCYAASLGGVATPVGTPTNLIAMDFISEATGREVRFVDWMKFGVPIMLVSLPAAWLLVTHGLPQAGHSAALEKVREERRGLGPWRKGEARVALVFALVAALWISRGFVQDWAKSNEIATPLVLGWTDASIAMCGVVAMALIPSGDEPRQLLTWNEGVRIPWGVLLLFGGGIALGGAVKETGLAAAMGEALSGLSVWPKLIFIAAIVALIVYLSEIMSNVAAMTTVGPMLGAVATGIGMGPEALFVTAAMAASCGFMLPAATGPNAVVYGTGAVALRSMLRAGFMLDLICVLIISAFGYMLVRAA
jgi:sodium-dependent dicarboxylate transporter 2/3/5